MSLAETVSARDARRLLLHGVGLSADPARHATPAAVRRTVQGMGFVQVDSINVVERAHHHILRTRLDGYQPAMLAKLLERDRTLFEHWTHDAAAIPTQWLAHWQHRFAAAKQRMDPDRSNWAKRLGDRPLDVIAHVRERLEREGPLRSADFEHPRDARGNWWSWKPQKTALEYLWHTGEVAISGRLNFQKLYDLIGRVLPEAAARPAPPREEHLAWACHTALERLGCATARELRDFLQAIELPEARAWCAKAEARGEIVPVAVETENGSGRRAAWALHDWRRRLARAREAPARARLLSPFDPVLRDRARAVRLFDFDYRFEAFVPAAKRRYGYYVLPVLEGDRLVARVDTKLHREDERLEIRGLWWQAHVNRTARRRRALERAAERFAEQIGAQRVRLPSLRQSKVA